MSPPTALPIKLCPARNPIERPGEKQTCFGGMIFFVSGGNLPILTEFNLLAMTIRLVVRWGGGVTGRHTTRQHWYIGLKNVCSCWSVVSSVLTFQKCPMCNENVQLLEPSWRKQWPNIQSSIHPYLPLGPSLPRLSRETCWEPSHPWPKLRLRGAPDELTKRAKNRRVGKVLPIILYLIHRNSLIVTFHTKCWSDNRVLGYLVPNHVTVQQAEGY